MNKHGHTGVRKRTDTNRSKPYYARISLGCDRFVYSKDFETAEEAAAEFRRLKGVKAPSEGATQPWR